MPINLTGSFTAIVTPFTDDGRAIDYSRLKEQIEFQARGENGTGGVRGIVIAGTTGETPTLSDAEYRQLAAKAIDIAHRNKLVAILGTGSNNTHHAEELQRFAKQAGADATLSVNPYYNKPVQEGLYEHFMHVADAAEMPIVLYNIPGRTGVALTPDTVARIAKHQNIQAIKEATGSTDSAGEIAMRCPHLTLLSGDDTMTLPFASVGARGVVSVVSNILPARINALCEAFLGDRWSEALKIHRELIPIAKAMFVETNPIPIKAAMAMAGRDSGVLRLPMTRASKQTLEALSRLELFAKVAV